MSYESINLGFSTADAEGVQLHFERGDLILRFVDWQEKEVQVVFREVLGFKWNDELDPIDHRDDCCYRVDESPWLKEQTGLAAIDPLSGYSHLRLCFNACGMLDVLARSHEVQPTKESTASLLESFHIDDDLNLAKSGAIEVSLVTKGERRWCYFMTPEALANAGDWVPGTEVRIHYAPNMIVVSEISEEVIEAALRHLASTGELEECTRAY